MDLVIRKFNFGILQIYSKTFFKNHFLCLGLHITQGMMFFVDIGGSMGLWIGWSLVTAFEFIEFFTDLVIISLIKRRSNKTGQLYSDTTQLHYHNKITQSSYCIIGDYLCRYISDELMLAAVCTI